MTGPLPPSGCPRPLHNGIIQAGRAGARRARARSHPRRMALLPGRKPPPRGTPAANLNANQRYGDLPSSEEAIPVPGAPSGLLGFLPTTGEGPGLAHLQGAAPSLGRGEPSPKKFRQNGCFGGVKRSERGLGESLLKRFPQAGEDPQPLAQGCVGVGKIAFPTRHAFG